ncbi:helix-turn-helix transcriptional regulator [Agromyces kandeliae]|uniref:PAS domain-containing protein n=1 Tax=Agromyces kandeliae TaxID=2666141 RepID=A0A6L5R1Z3_9MICO|nr:PAS domain-containing protein [Agromyces kandeliae]MRX43604.1 PAS domain-containing protein [Agromyces kandeliae]
MDPEQYADVVDLIYAGATVPGAWTDAMRGLASVVGGDVAAVLVSGPAEGRFTPANIALDEVAMRAYGERYARIDPVVRAMRATTERVAIDGDDVVTAAEKRRSEFFADWARPNGLDHCVCGVVDRAGEMLTWVVIAGSAPRRERSEDPADLLRPFLPHLERAVAVERRLDREAGTGWCAGAIATIDLLGAAVLAVDADGRVRHANPAAADLLGRGTAVHVDRGGRLLLSVAAEQDGLRRLLRRAARPDASGTRVGGRMRAHRTDGLPCYVHVIPFGVAAGRDWAALVVVTDPVGGRGVPPDVLRAVFGLTPAEAIVAAAVTAEHAGGGLDRVAEGLGVSLSTLRVHLQHVFEKTGVHRQADLARLVTVVSGGFRDDANGADAAARDLRPVPGEPRLRPPR